ncbi:MAG: hypothetical protein VB092_06830 [Oscillospiraceae bacterium]|nr:hypothetical protein [Oscillospiraceae bacterium]
MDGTQAVILFYAAALIVYGSVRARSSDGGRAEPSLFAAVMSLCAGFIGGGFSLGNAAAGFTGGVGNAAALCGFSLGQALVAAFAAPRLVRFSGARTAGDLIACAFGDTAKRFTGLLSVLFCTGVLGAQISAFGAVAGYIFGAHARLCAAAGFAVIIAYTALGGPNAARGSDAVQIPALVLALAAALALLLPRAGGFAGLFAALPASFGSVCSGGPAAFLYMFLTFMLGEMLCPPYLARMLGSQDARRIRRACGWSAALSVPFFFVSALLGMLARALQTTRSASHALPSALAAALPFPLGALALGALLCGGAALALALAFEDVLSILIIAYCFWCPAMLLPLLFALRGRRADGRLFFCSAGLSVGAVLLWRLLGEPLGVPPMLAGLAASAAVFAAHAGYRKRK